MKKLFVVCFAVFISSFVISCSSSKEEIETIPVEERFAKAKVFFDQEDYLKAIEEFKLISVQNQGSEYADKAQYYLAECRFIREEYILAATEYDNLVRTMPTSPFASLSRFKQALSYYKLSPRASLDQKYTRLALDQFQTYIEYSPKDSLVKDAEVKIAELTNKLTEKLFESGKLYYRLEYYKAATAYFEKVISEYQDSKVVESAMFWKAKTQTKRKDFDGATSMLSELLAKFPTTDLKSEVVILQKNIEDLKSEKIKEDQDKLTAQ